MWHCCCLSLSVLEPPQWCGPTTLRKPSITAWFLNLPKWGFHSARWSGYWLKSAGWLAMPIFPKIGQPSMWNANLSALRENKNSGYAIMEQSKTVEFLVLCFIHSIIRFCLLDQALLAVVHEAVRPRSWMWSTYEPTPAPLSVRWNSSHLSRLDSNLISSMKHSLTLPILPYHALTPHRKHYFLSCILYAPEAWNGGENIGMNHSISIYWASIGCQILCRINTGV